MSGGLGAWPTDAELEKVAQLRAAFTEPLAARQARGALHECLFGDVALCRVLRGNSGSLEESANWFANFLVKMDEYEVDQIVVDMTEKLEESESGMADATMLPFNSEVVEFARCVVSAPNLTPDGDVIWYLPMVDQDRWGILAELEWRQFVSWARALMVLRCLELEKLSRKHQRMARCIMLVDMADCGFNLLTCPAFDKLKTRDIDKFGEEITTHIIKHTVVLNMPSTIERLGNLGKHFMPSKFRNKVRMSDGNGLGDAKFVEELGGRQQLEQLFASRVGLVLKSRHVSKALNAADDDALPSEAELKVIGRLRLRFKDELDRREAEGRLHLCFFGDIALARVLRGNEASFTQAMEWFETFLKRMDEWCVDALVDDMTAKLDASGSDRGDVSMLPYFEEVRPFFTWVFSAPQLTSDGDVVSYFPMIDYDRWGILQEIDWDHFVHYWRCLTVLRCIELDRLSQTQNRMVRALILVDIADCSMNQLQSKAFHKAWNRDIGPFAQEIASNIIKQFVVVNPSWAVTQLYNVVSMVISAQVLKKLHFQKGDPCANAAFSQEVGGKEQLEQLFATRQGLVENSVYYQNAFVVEQDDRMPTERELVLIGKLRERYKPMLARREEAGKLHPCFFGDIALARVLRGNEGDIGMASEWFEEFLKKAEEFQIDSLVEDVEKACGRNGVERGDSKLLPFYDEVKDHFKCIFTAPKLTPKGDVVWYLPMSDVSRDGIAQNVEWEHYVRFVRCLLVLRCLQAECLSRTQKRMVKAFLILDMNGSGMSITGMPTSPDFDERNENDVFTFMKSCMVEVLAPSYVLNAPWITVKAYNWFKSLVPEKLSRKLNMLVGDGAQDEDFVELVGGEEQLKYLLGSRVGLLEGITDSSEGEQVVAASDSFEKRRDMREGQVISWRFQIQAGSMDSLLGAPDLGFSVSALWFPDLAVGDSAEEVGSKLLGSTEPDQEEIRAEEIFSSEQGWIEGGFTAQRTGVVALMWTNTHSRLRSKSVKYAVEVSDAACPTL